MAAVASGRLGDAERAMHASMLQGLLPQGRPAPPESAEAAREFLTATLARTGS